MPGVQVRDMAKTSLPCRAFHLEGSLSLFQVGNYGTFRNRDSKIRLQGHLKVVKEQRRGSRTVAFNIERTRVIFLADLMDKLSHKDI